ncbi:lipopolysaccharide biosynthesis protein [Sphingobacterium hotanense]|uniref:lipopolysaccharide biosynthesis protein n=1 Tax=Sphingobacterium hotanense TaxID=649196 RepID=UPI0021A4966B|nr:MATE family efflux transporter [Sphingobacterium hotanense]MCT1523551.1 MATE family efflux transporter [Sphingobacterium hotanense]
MGVASNNKRILLNTFYLYGRMLLLMLVSLFTVREIFNALGVVDYGLYNVVAGIVVLFSFLSNTMLGASQRFFSYDIGKNDIVKLKRTFSVTLSIYFFIAFVVLILAETLGVWFLNHKMNIPENRLYASNWVYQFSIISFIVSILTIPYTALLVAHEKLKFYAYLGILEAILKLLIVYLLLIVAMDRLILYGGLLLGVTLINSLIYFLICKKKFPESNYSFIWDKEYFKELLSFSGWNLFGAFAGVLNNQGINILLNMFFGAVLNSARAIAIQINSVLNLFVSNLMLSVRPQITKYYAQDDRNNMLKLVFQSSKIGFYLLTFLSIPILLNAELIIKLWLGNVQEYVVLFVRITILTTLIDSISYPLMTAAQATGNVKRYQIIVGGFLLLNVPVTYTFYKIGYPPEYGLYVIMVTSTICLFFRLVLLKSLISLPILTFAKEVLLRCLLVFTFVSLPLLYFKNYFSDNVIGLFSFSFVAILFSIFIILLMGLSSDEKNILINVVKSKILKKV